jgi:hypothetical protein
MIINDRTIKTIDDLKEGDVFVCNSHYYMKIAPIASAASGATYNAVHLHSGVPMEITYNTHITPVKCELVIEN